MQFLDIFFICSQKCDLTQILLNLNYKQVLKFTQQQKTLVATMRRFSVMKKESSITRDIKLQAESLHRRLDALSKQVQRTEDQQGPTAVTTRIQRSQHAALYRKFQQVGRKILKLCNGNSEKLFTLFLFLLPEMFLRHEKCCVEHRHIVWNIRMKLSCLREWKVVSTKMIHFQLKSDLRYIYHCYCT